MSSERVVIYDSGTSGGSLSPSERVAACYRWASAREYAVLEQTISWDTRGTHIPPALAAVLDTCVRKRADLLVYTLDCLGDEDTRAAVVERLGQLRLLTVHAAPAALCEAAS
jgi:hypothetical protein